MQHEFKPRRAVAVMRDQLHYRKSAFRHGLEVVGFEVRDYISNPGPGDVLVIWNRSFRGAEEAQQYERGGAMVLIAENGLFGKFNEESRFSLAKHHIAGVEGDWPDGGPSRWDTLGLTPQPWKVPGSQPLIIGQRGIGERGVGSPEHWAERTQQRYGGRIRAHPGKYPAKVSLADDMANDVSCVITWASSVGLQALLHGVPVFHEHPRWCGAEAALPLMLYGKVEPKRDDEARMRLFRRIAWAVWSLEEIDNGNAFAHLLGLKVHA